MIGTDAIVSARFSRVVAAALVAWGLLWAQGAAAKDRFEVGEEVPDFTLKVVNKDTVGKGFVTLEKFFGAAAEEPKKATVVSFFATYCEPCKREIPYLAALYETFKDKGLQILLVTIDKEAPKIDEAGALAEQAKVTFPLLSDRFNIVARRYYIEKLPCVYILDGDGKVAMVNVGYSDDVSQLFLNEIRKNLGEPLSDPVPDSLKSYIHATPPVAAGAETSAGTASAEASGDAGADAGSDDAGGEHATAAADGGAEESPTVVAEPAEDSSKAGKKRKKKRKKKRRR